MSVRLKPEVFAHELAIRGLTQAEVARRSGLTKQTVCIAGKGRTVTPETLRKIAKVLSEVPPIAEDLVADAG